MAAIDEISAALESLRLRKTTGYTETAKKFSRHQRELLIHYTTNLNRSRKQADSALNYTLYFKLLRKKIEEYSIDTQQIFNIDKKGFLIGILSKSKRVFTQPRWQSKESRTLLQDGNREWITVLPCICADGTALTPSLIYQAASGNIQDTWL
ncbi:hypothetical protein PtrM4_104840 [Pyrenophora tritici-repentis]|uniref:Uncharacterized protein n=1 Tax=Pyrenophora tritici-repentis TaxID=45151 RepID=A0A834RYK0_9PLEO|nr:hypothetical protein PtrM4_104840 [Pyrenophora tritici-repentis]